MLEEIVTAAWRCLTGNGAERERSSINVEFNPCVTTVQTGRHMI